MSETSPLRIVSGSLVRVRGKLTGGTFSVGNDEDEVGSFDEGAPFGVKLLICFLLADSLRRTIELVSGPAPMGDQPSRLIFILWILIDLLLALLIALRTRAGRYWTQAILAIHVFYLGHELAVRDPYLWLSMGVVHRWQTVGTVLLDGLFVAYLSSGEAKRYLQDGP